MVFQFWAKHNITWACCIFLLQIVAVCWEAALKLNHIMGIRSSLMYTTLKQAEMHRDTIIVCEDIH